MRAASWTSPSSANTEVAYVPAGRAKLVPVPVAAVGLALWCLSRLPRYRDFNIEMARRMGKDMVFDHGDALRDFGYRPRSFEPVVERPV